MQIVAWLIKAHVRLQGSTRITVKKRFCWLYSYDCSWTAERYLIPAQIIKPVGFWYFFFLLSAKVITRSTGQNANARVIKRPASSVGRAWDS